MRFLNSRVLIIVGVIFAGCLVLVFATGAIINSTHPDKKVRDGKVIKHRFVPAHNETYFIQQYAGQSCYSSYNSTTKSMSETCTPRYISVPQTDHIPDAWFITVQGCKRLKAESQVDYCDKPAKRTVHVDEIEYHQLKIGAEWHEISS